jgi:hypothetical protein
MTMRTFFSLITVSALMGLSWQGSAQLTCQIETASGTTPLHMGTSASPGAVAAHGTELWFVSDMNGKGLSGFGSDVLASVFDAIVASLGDDRLFLESQVNGFGGGTYQNVDFALPADKTSDSKTYYAILWDVAGGAAGTAGAKFDYELMSFTPVGEVGNAQMQITSDMFADTFTVIPEPAETAAYTGFALLGSALAWRRWRKFEAVVA